MHLMGMVIETLDVADSSGHFRKHVQGGSGLIRWNFYPACPEPQKTLGMNVHTDFTLLTILHLGDVGGLQVLKGGQWMAVKPRHDAFAINIGDMLQVTALLCTACVALRPCCSFLHAWSRSSPLKSTNAF